MSRIGSDVIGKNDWEQPRPKTGTTYYVKTESRHGVQGLISVSTKQKGGDADLAVKGNMKDVIRKTNEYLARKGKKEIIAIEIDGTPIIFNPRLWFM